MARFIATKGITSEISDVITNAVQSVVLITPYVQVGNYFKDKLIAAGKRGVVTKLVCRPKNLTEEQRTLLLSIPKLELYFHHHVHSKCYYNERMMVIGSMNFFEYSDQNNREMGIVLDKNLDTDLFSAAQKESEEIIGMSNLLNRSYSSQTSSKANNGQPNQKPHFLERVARIFLHEGFCIRCRTELREMNPRYPLCSSCYKIWASWGDPEYIEKYCHCCGHESKTTIDKPLCRDCFNTR